MIPVLNAVGVHAAVYGNHDFGEWTVYSPLTFLTTVTVHAVIEVLECFQVPLQCFALLKLPLQEKAYKYMWKSYTYITVTP